MKREEYYEERGLDRIISLSDGVFAFSLTLLALNLVVPELPGGDPSLLYQGLINESMHFLYFFLTFIITGAYWSTHHRIFRFIRRYDGVLMRLNMFLLLFIILMPFITQLNIEYGHEKIAVLIAAMGYAIPGLLLSLIWHYSSKGYRLIDKNLPSDFAWLTTLKNYISPAVFICSMPFAFINPAYVAYFWILLFPIRLILDHLYPGFGDED